jgi:hypothetical protein
VLVVLFFWNEFPFKISLFNALFASFFLLLISGVFHNDFILAFTAAIPVFADPKMPNWAIRCLFNSRNCVVKTKVKSEANSVYPL